MRHVWSDHLHMQEQVFSQRMCNPPPYDINMPVRISDQIAGGIKHIRINLAKRMADIVDDGIGKTIQQMA